MNENNNTPAVTPNVTAKITWINNKPTEAKKAAATITIADSFAVHGISIVEGQKGLFISMPQRASERRGETKYFEIAHPITAEFRQAMQNAVFEAYSQAQALAQQYRKENTFQKPIEQERSPSESTEPVQEGDETFPFSLDEPNEAESDNVPILGLMM